MNTTLRRTSVAAMALTVSFGMAACGSDDSADSSSSTTEESSSAPASPSEEASPTEEAAASGEFGAACADVPATGAGSFQGMSEAPVATAASNNPVLSTLVEAVGAANLVDTLNDLPEATVFAPANAAFEAVPPRALNQLLQDTDALTNVLTYHVLPERVAPEDLAGTHTTVQGEDLEVEGSGEDFTVNGDASIVCGNVQTANATVYIIDGVLMPPAN